MITLGSLKRSAPSPTCPVEALEPAHRYMARALGWRVSVVEGEVRAGGGTQAANLLSQGRAAGTGPRQNSSPVLVESSNSHAHIIRIHAIRASGAGRRQWRLR